MRENRIKVILLFSDGRTRKEIKEILLLDFKTIRRYICDFIHYGMDSIEFKDNRKDNSGNSMKISEAQKNEIEKYLEENIVTEAKEIQKYILDNFKIKYSLSGTINLLHKLGYTFKQVVQIPQKANTEEAVKEQMRFECNYNNMKNNMNENEKIYFIDAVHPTHNATKGYAWVKSGEEKVIETNSGRSRININGAYNPQDGELITIEAKTIDSEAVKSLFDEILKINSNTTDNIYIFSDNARYYKSKFIQELLREDKYKRIKLIFLPTYSPNLNPIERVWKFLKKYVLKNKFYKTFKEFKEAISLFLDEEIKSQSMKEKLKKFASDIFHIRRSEKICNIDSNFVIY